MVGCDCAKEGALHVSFECGKKVLSKHKLGKKSLKLLNTFVTHSPEYIFMYTSNSFTLLKTLLSLNVCLFLYIFRLMKKVCLGRT